MAIGFSRRKNNITQIDDRRLKGEILNAFGAASERVQDRKFVSISEHQRKRCILSRMGKRKKVIAGALTIAVAVFASVAALQARAVEWKASGVRAGMPFAEVSRQLDGWSMINVHPLGRGTQNRAKSGPEYLGYSGEVYVLTPIDPDGRETDLRKRSRAEFEWRLEKLLSDVEPWTVYFNFRITGPDTGVLVRFDGHGKVASQ